MKGVVATTTNTGQVYTCPMHPEVRLDQPGKCPKCGMTLVPVKGGEAYVDPRQSA